MRGYKQALFALILAGSLSGCNLAPTYTSRELEGKVTSIIVAHEGLTGRNGLFVYIQTSQFHPCPVYISSFEQEKYIRSLFGKRVHVVSRCADPYDCTAGFTVVRGVK